MMNTLLGKEVIVNPRTQRCYRVISCLDIPSNSAVYQVLCDICNQPSVYQASFARQLRGQYYDVAMAQDFIAQAKKSWYIGESFVFCIVAEECAHLPVGMVTIKSNNRRCAELGYWCSEWHRGVMTCALEQVCRIASGNGFWQLKARVKPENLASIRVLNNLGFVLQQTTSRNKNILTYTKVLSTDSEYSE